MHAAFGPDEEAPEAAMQNLTAEARWQVEWLLREATRVTGTTGPDMNKRFTNAERALVQASALSAGFGFDVKPVETKLAWVRTQQAVARGETTPAPAPVVTEAPKNHGQELLEQARASVGARPEGPEVARLDAVAGESHTDGDDVDIPFGIAVLAVFDPGLDEPVVLELADEASVGA